MTWPPFHKPGDWGFYNDGTPVLPGHPNTPGATESGTADPSKAQPQAGPGMAVPDNTSWAAGRFPPPGQGPVYPPSENPNAFPGQPNTWEPEASRGILPPEAIAELIKTQLADFAARGQMGGRPHWFSPVTAIPRLKPATTPPTDIVGRTILGSPTFDLRPDLKSLTGSWNENAIPMWRPETFGAGLTLYLQIFGNINLIEPTLRVYGIEHGNIMASGDGSQLSSLQHPQELTADFYDGSRAAILKWTVPGFKYWQVDFRIDQIDGELNELGTDLKYQWAMY